MKIVRSLYLVEPREDLKISIEAYTSTPAQPDQLTTLIIRCSCPSIEDSVKLYAAAFGSEHFLEEDEVLAIARRYCKDKNIDTRG